MYVTKSDFKIQKGYKWYNLGSVLGFYLAKKGLSPAAAMGGIQVTKIHGRNGTYAFVSTPEGNKRFTSNAGVVSYFFNRPDLESGLDLPESDPLLCYYDAHVVTHYKVLKEAQRVADIHARNESEAKAWAAASCRDAEIQGALGASHYRWEARPGTEPVPIVFKAWYEDYLRANPEDRVGFLRRDKRGF